MNQSDSSDKEKKMGVSQSGLGLGVYFFSHLIDSCVSSVALPGFFFNRFSKLHESKGRSALLFFGHAATRFPSILVKSAICKSERNLLPDSVRVGSQLRSVELFSNSNNYLRSAPNAVQSQNLKSIQKTRNGT